MLLASSAGAQNTNKPSDSDRAQVYLKDKQAAQQRFAGGLTASGRGSDAKDMAQAIRGGSPPRGRSVQLSAELNAALDEAFYQDAALELSALGFSLGDLRSTRGPALIRAAIAKRTASAGHAELALLSDTVGIGTVTAVNLDTPSADGLGGRVTVRLEDVGKGNLRPGDALALVMVSGSRDSSGRLLLDSSEYVPAVGARVAFYASRSAYAPNSAARGRGPKAQVPTAMRLVNLLEISGESAISHDAFLPNTTVDQIKAAGARP